MVVSEISGESHFYLDLARLETREQKRKYMARLFERLIRSPAVRDSYIDRHDITASEKIQPSEDHIYDVAIKVLGNLYALGRNPAEWDEAKVNSILENGVADYWNAWKRRRNDTCLLSELQSPTSESSALVMAWLEEGCTIESSDIYQTLFGHQNEYTAKVVEELLEEGFLPETNNIHSLFIHQTEHTLEILKVIAPFELFSPTCLTFALRFSGKYTSSLIHFLLDEQVAADKYHWSFARKHLGKDCQSLLERSFRLASDTSDKRCIEDDFIALGSQPSVLSLPDLSKIVNNPTKDSLSYLVAHIHRGSRLAGWQFNMLIDCHKPFSLELLRVYFMHGFNLTPGQLKNLMKKDNGYVHAIIQLARMYGFKVTDSIVNRHMENSSENTINALTMEVPLYPVMDRKALDNLVNQYVSGAPGIFELLIRSGVHPSEQLLRDYKEIPKVKFFNHLLENEPFFESNSYNQKLLKIATQTSTSDIIQKLFNKGFRLRVEDAVKAIPHQPRHVGGCFIDELKKNHHKSNGSYECGGSMLTGEMLDDPIAMALYEQNADTARKLQRYIEKGVRPSENHVHIILSNKTIYSPELIYILEEHGVSIECI